MAIRKGNERKENEDERKLNIIFTFFNILVLFYISLNFLYEKELI